MVSDLPESPILEQERLAIELLARETHTTIARVQEVFLEEYRKLAEGAHIKSFLPVLTGNHVRNILTGRNAGGDAASHHPLAHHGTVRPR
jgi:hypothetical protein